LIPLGVSVFDLIMPWKTEVKTPPKTDLNKLATIVNCSAKKPV
jgi:hypothetical protein